MRTLALASLVALTLVGCHSDAPCNVAGATRQDGVCVCEHGAVQQNGETVCLEGDGAVSVAPDASADASADGGVADATSADATSADAAVSQDASSDASASDDAALLGDDASTSDAAAASCDGGACANFVTQVASGWDHTCALTAANTVYCWGDNTDSYTGQTVVGKLGAGTLATKSATPVLVTGLTDVVEITAGAGHSCARQRTGEVLCWGWNAAHQLGTSSASSAVPLVIPVTGAVQMSAGAQHTCARLASGGVSCWGGADQGQLGGRSLSDGADGSVVSVANVSAVAEVASGGKHTCARSTAGTVTCWGNNASGQLGGTSSGAVPFVTVNLSNVRAVSAGFTSTCAVSQDHVAQCWGDTDAPSNQAGFTVADSAQPVANTRASNLAQLSLGYYYACAAQLGGQVLCWGQNAAGELGYDPSTRMHGDPDVVPGLSGVMSVSSGQDHVCALLGDGSVRCWGNNQLGQLASTSIPFISATPLVISGL